MTPWCLVRAGSPPGRIFLRCLIGSRSNLCQHFPPEMSLTPADSLKTAKNLLRKEVKKKVRAMSVEEKNRQSEIVTNKLLACDRYRSSSRISIYVSTDLEISTEPIIKQILQDGKECFIPKYDETCQEMDMIKLSSMEELSSLPTTKWNIKQHNHSNTEEALASGGLDLIVVPGVAFSPSGGRLGHGKGYYDIYYQRCLATCKPYTIGLCFAEQLVPSVPLHDHDLIVDQLLHPVD